MKITGAVLQSLGDNRPYSRGRPILVTELELDPPGPHEVLVEIDAATICHSDLSVVNGSRPRPTPMLLGHEAAGRVLQIGSEVHDRYVGQQVILTFLPRCGNCAGCASGGRAPCIPGSLANSEGVLMGGGRRLHFDGEEVYHHLGVSGFATHAVVRVESTVPFENVPPVVAALLGCAVLTGGGAVLNAGQPQPGERIAIVGLGGVGMAALLVAASVPGTEVVAIDSLASKTELALSFGATSVLSPSEAADSDFTADVVIEAAGNVAALSLAIDITAPGGRTVTVGLPPPGAVVDFSPVRLVGEGRSIIGSYLGSAIPERDIPRFIGLWREGRLPIERLISGEIDLDDINEGMDRLADGSVLRQSVRI